MLVRAMFGYDFYSRVVLSCFLHFYNAPRPMEGIAAYEHIHSSITTLDPIEPSFVERTADSLRSGGPYPASRALVQFHTPQLQEHTLRVRVPFELRGCRRY